MYSEIAKLLRRARRDKGITQKNLAGQLGYHAQFISNWERGRSVPPPGCWRDLCRILSLDAQEVLRVLMNYERKKWQAALTNRT